MALTVESGIGLADADALVSLDYVNTYFGVGSRGNTAWTGIDALKEAAIRRASFFLSNSYDWKGVRLNGRDQSLAWPRSYVYDAEDLAVPDDAVPVEVKQATAEVALRELTSPGSMTPDITASSAIKRQRKKVGELETEIEYLNSSASAQPALSIVRDLIGGLLDQGAMNALVGSSYRV